MVIQPGESDGFFTFPGVRGAVEIRGREFRVRGALHESAPGERTPLPASGASERAGILFGQRS